MSLFIRLSTQVLTDSKFFAAGPEASWLWVKGLLYAKEHLTDGFIPEGALPLISVGLGNPKKAIQKLLACDLWREAPGGYTVGNERWARWQTTKEQVETQRKGWRDRQQASRQRHSVTPPVSHSLTGQQSHSEVTPPEHRVQSTGSVTEGGRARGAPPDPRDMPSTDDWIADPEENIREGLEAHQYADGLLEVMSISKRAAYPVFVAMVDALPMLARDESCSLGEAARRMLSRMRAASHAGSVKWRFWLGEEGGWKQTQAHGVSTAGWEDDSEKDRRTAEWLAQAD